jgi:hypothetical protein
LHKDAGGDDRLRIELAQRHHVGYLRDSDPGGGGHDRTEVARGLAVYQVAAAVAALRLDQRKVGGAAHPRVETFKEDIIRAFANGMAHKPLSTFGTVNDDVLALKQPGFRRMNFCSIILGSSWDDGKLRASCCDNPLHQH